MDDEATLDAATTEEGESLDLDVYLIQDDNAEHRIKMSFVFEVAPMVYQDLKQYTTPVVCSKTVVLLFDRHPSRLIHAHCCHVKTKTKGILGMIHCHRRSLSCCMRCSPRSMNQ